MAPRPDDTGEPVTPAGPDAAGDGGADGTARAPHDGGAEADELVGGAGRDGGADAGEQDGATGRDVGADADELDPGMRPDDVGSDAPPSAADAPDGSPAAGEPAPPTAPDDGATVPDGDHGLPDDAPAAAAAEPAPAGTDEDAEWRDLVRRLQAMGLGEADPDDTPERRVLRPASPLGRPRPGTDAGRPEAPRPAATRSWSPDPDLEEREDHFEPPDPGPVLGGDPLATMAWAAVLGFPLLLVLTVVVWRDAPPIVLQVTGVAFFAAVGLLLWRMPHRRDDDAGPGAVV